MFRTFGNPNPDLAECFTPLGIRPLILLNVWHFGHPTPDLAECFTLLAIRTLGVRLPLVTTIAFRVSPGQAIQHTKKRSPQVAKSPSPRAQVAKPKRPRRDARSENNPPPEGQGRAGH